LALSADNLAAGLTNSNMQSLSTDFDEQGDYAIYSGLDEEWTDVGADGETDDEPENHEDEVMISFQDTTGSK
jgi:hypothetical protein